jgi:hypothetical protein
MSTTPAKTDTARAKTAHEAARPCAKSCPASTPDPATAVMIASPAAAARFVGLPADRRPGPLAAGVSGGAGQASTRQAVRRPDGAASIAPSEAA